MNASQKFVYAHRTKLAWKMFKHGMGVALMTEEREGQEGFKLTPGHVQSEEYLEVPCCGKE